MRVFRVLVTAALLLGWAPSARAQEIPPPPEEGVPAEAAPTGNGSATAAWMMDEVTVTATRSRRNVNAVPASVSVLTRDGFGDSAASNADDLVRTLPGVDVKRVAGIASGLPSRISLRGVPGANRTLVLMDGIPMNAAGTGFMSLNSVPLGITERLEVVRGPFSSLYGSNAFGGVVQLFTLDPAGTARSQATGGWGGYGYRDSSVLLIGPLGPAGVLIHADRRSIDNFLAGDRVLDRSWDPSTGGWRTVGKPEENHPYEQERLFGKAVLEPSRRARITLHAQSVRDRMGYGKTLFLAEPCDVDIENLSTLGAARVHWAPSDRLEMEGGAHARRRSESLFNESYSHMNPFPPFPVYVPSVTHTRYLDLQGDLQAVWRAHPSHTLTFGGESLLNEGDFDPAVHAGTGVPVAGGTGSLRSIHNVALYAQEEASLGERLRIVPGARLDRHSRAGSVLSPKAGLILDASRTLRLRSSWGRAFRAPTLAEAFMPDVASIPGVVLRSNPDLRPEILTAVDAGIEKTLSPALTAGLEAFHNRMRDLISLARMGATMTYVNVSSARSTGLTSTLAWRPSPWLSAELNHTYQWAEDATTGAVLDYMPLHKANAVLVLSRSSGPWRGGLDLRGTWSGRRTYTDSSSGRQAPLEPYVSLDAGFRIGWRETAWAHMMVTNVFDESYEETGEVPAPGRLVILSAGAGF